MRMLNMIKLDPAAGGAGGGGGTPPLAPTNVPNPPSPAHVPTPPWYSTLTDEGLRANPSIISLKSVDDLAKGYVSAQQMIGTKRVAVPGERATPEQWNEFYQTIGRPEAPDKYSAPTVKLAEGLNVDEAGYTAAKATFHKLGLTDQQARGILDFYNEGLNKNHGTLKSQGEASTAAAASALRQEWGDKYDANLNIAQSVLRKFGDTDALREIDAGLGNNPALVKFFHKMGMALLDDKTRGGGVGQLEVGSAAQALAKIGELKRDEQFQKALNTGNIPGHAEAVSLWTETHRLAYPTKKPE